MDALSVFYAGIGDIIALSGAITVLAKNRPVNITVFEFNKASAKSFFVDHPLVTVTGIQQTSKEQIEGLLREGLDKLNGFTNLHPDLQKLDLYHRTYLSFGVDYECRWSCSPIPKAAELVDQHVVGSDDYIFVHESRSRGFFIDKEKLPKRCDVFLPGFDTQTSILTFKDAIERAREVHVIDSSMFHLAEQIEPRGKLFLHRYARPYYPQIHNYLTRHQWTEVW